MAIKIRKAAATTRDAGPEIDDLLADEQVARGEHVLDAEPAPAPTPVQIPPAPKLRTVQLAAPLAPFRDNVHLSTHVEVRFEPQQARTMRRLFDGLDQAGARLKNGRRVSSPADSVRWLLEQLDEGGS